MFHSKVNKKNKKEQSNLHMSCHRFLPQELTCIFAFNGQVLLRAAKVAKLQLNLFLSFHV